VSNDERRESMTIGKTLANALRSIGITAAAAFLLSFGAGAGPAHASVQVHGDISALRVDCTDASVADVMAALELALKIRYHTTAPLEGTVHGSYSGSLGRVLSSVLDDYNYVVKTSGQTVEVVVVGRHGNGPRSIITRGPQIAPKQAPVDEVKGAVASKAGPSPRPPEGGAPPRPPDTGVLPRRADTVARPVTTGAPPMAPMLPLPLSVTSAADPDFVPPPPPSGGVRRRGHDD
jgi:hypothetical protein